MVPQLTMGPAKTKTTQPSPKMAKLAVWSESGCQGGNVTGPKFEASPILTPRKRSWLGRAF